MKVHLPQSHQPSFDQLCRVSFQEWLQPDRWRERRREVQRPGRTGAMPVCECKPGERAAHACRETCLQRHSCRSKRADRGVRFEDRLYGTPLLDPQTGRNRWATTKRGGRDSKTRVCHTCQVVILGGSRLRLLRVGNRKDDRSRYCSPLVGAVPSRRIPSERMAAGGTDVAFGDALVSRELRLSEIAAWMRAQESLRSERASATATLRVLEETVQLFLEGYTGLRGDDSQRELLIDRKGGTVAVMRMSDGERGTLALILDLTRRLVQANPEMDNPVVEAEAVVLIDELDLHLHPAWQRLIVHKLTSTFPRCQFIATTHSPQVIGEVEHDRIHIMTGGEVYPPSHSFGVDSSRVLDEIMDAERRTKIAQDLLAQMSATIGGQHYEAARRLLPRIVEVLGEADPEVTRIETLLDFLEDTE